MRTVGVEEELLLVDMHTGRPRSVASQVIPAAADKQVAHAGGAGGVEAELQRYMVETQIFGGERRLPASPRSPLPRWRVPV